MCVLYSTQKHAVLVFFFFHRSCGPSWIYSNPSPIAIAIHIVRFKRVRAGSLLQKLTPDDIFLLLGIVTSSYLT